jgi:uroporphyrinogen decarboxylase
VTDRFLRACRRETVDRTPVWLMRQAGRWLPEYRALRARHDLRTLVSSPDLLVEATLQPLHRLAVDAAPVYAEVLLPLEAAGLHLALDGDPGGRPGRIGITDPIRSSRDVDRLRAVDPRDAPGLRPTLEALTILRAELNGPAVVGVAAAPFSLAAYAVEGEAAGSFAKTRALMTSDSAAWNALCALVGTMVADYLVAQAEAGAQAIVLFDSWSQALTAEEYAAFALPHSRAVCQRVAATGVPLVHYGTGRAVLEGLAAAGGDVIGVDWRTPLDEAWARIGHDRGIQGNLAPTALLAPFEQMLEAATDVLERAEGRPGHVFNLGHGLLASTPVEHVAALVRYVQMQTEH